MNIILIIEEINNH